MFNRWVSFLLFYLLLTSHTGVFAFEDPCSAYQDSTQTKCSSCSTDYYLTIFEGIILCSSLDDTTSNHCSLAPYYGPAGIGLASDPGTLYKYTLTSGEEYCYSCDGNDSDGSSTSAFENCKICGDSYEGSATESALVTSAL